MTHAMLAQCAGRLAEAEERYLATGAGLLRAGSVVSGLDLARERRPATRRDSDLAAGPAKLMQVLALNRAANGTSVIDGTGPLTVSPPDSPDFSVTAGPRVGVTSAHDAPLPAHPDSTSADIVRETGRGPP